MTSNGSDYFEIKAGHRTDTADTTNIWILRKTRDKHSAKILSQEDE